MDARWFLELTEDQVRHIDEECVRFDRALRESAAEGIEEILNRSPSQLRNYLFDELLSAEMEFHLTAGAAVNLDDYFERFADRKLDVIRIYRETQAALATAPVAPSPEQREAKVVFNADELPKAFGRYMLKQLLGTGAMGTVYLALDSQLDRRVAVKLPHHNDKSAVDWFRHEARALASVRHVNVCPIHDWGLHNDRPFLVMAYLAGETLAEQIQRGDSYSARHTAVLCQKIAAGLAALHCAGVVHRDVKPANIMIDESNEPILMDFGLVRRPLATEQSSRPMIVGSPGYMAPEQAAGDEAHVGPHSDIYALGTILYQLLCGRRPFEGNAASILKKLATQTPPAPSTIRRNVDPRLDAICMQALARDPAKRFGTASAFAEALSDYLAELPFDARELNQATSEPQRVSRSSVVLIGGHHRRWLIAFLGLTSIAFVASRFMLPRTAHRKQPAASNLGGGTSLFHLALDAKRLTPTLLPPSAIPSKRSRGEFIDSGQRLGNGASCAVDTGDLDGDGDLDALIVNSTGPHEIWFNDGAAKFTLLGETIPDEGVTNAAKLGDLDGDGDLDLYLAKPGPDSIWLNDGSGKFSDSKQRLGEIDTTKIELADLDGDHDLDAIALNAHGPTIVWKNDGAGRFVADFQFSESPGATCFALGDLDDDGDLDAFICKNRSHDEVWRNDGTGEFSLSESLLLSFSDLYRDRKAATIVDADNDGDLDIFVMGSFKLISFLRNDGQGSFRVSQRSSLPVNATHMLAADFDGNLSNDLIVLNQFPSDPHFVFMNEDDEQSLPNIRWFGQSAAARGGSAGDFDKDGDIDVLVVSGSPSSCQVWINCDLDQTFPQARFKRSPINLPFTFGIHAEDLDVDSDVDLYLVATGHDLIFLNDGQGNYTDSMQRLGNSPGSQGAVGDLNADGAPDLIVPSYGQEPTGIYLNDGAGRFVQAQELTVNYCSAVALGDLDNDGDLDFILGIAGPGGPDEVWFNDGHGNFSHVPEAAFSLAVGEITQGMALADVDRDGDLDAFVVGVGSPHRLWLNRGNGHFDDSGQRFPQDLNAKAVSFADVDGDHDFDAVVAYFDGANRIFLNNGQGQLDEGSVRFDPSETESVVTADLDGDGDVDAITPSYNGPVGVWFNDGNGDLGAHVQWLPIRDSWGAVATDIDGDGDLDLVVGSSSSPTQIWINQTLPISE